MTAELAAVERKADLALAKLDLVLTKIEEMNYAGRPGLSQVEFAKLVRVHPRTVNRWRRDGKLRIKNGVVPNSEVQRFLS